jgi:hypothetical protein
MWRIICLAALSLAISSPVPAAANPVPERFLIGDWQNEDGTLLLELRADRQAVFTVPTLRKGETTEPRSGRFYVKDGLWTLEETDLNHRTERYKVVSHDFNTLNLFGRNEARITLYRIGVRFSDLDRNRDGILEHDEVKDTRLGLYFNDIDSNKDVQLTPAEFVTYWRRFPPPVVMQR